MRFAMGMSPLSFALIATAFFIQVTLVNAFSISLSCNAPCTNLTEDGIPADGLINAAWDAPELQPNDQLSFRLRWTPATGLNSPAVLFNINTTAPDKSAYVANRSTTLQMPHMYIPAGDNYYIEVINWPSFDTGQSLGPYKMSEAYSSYPKPIQDRKYNFTITLECSQQNSTCEDGRVTNYLDEDLVVKWASSQNATFDHATISLYWGNPVEYGDYPSVIDSTNSLWYGEMEDLFYGRPFADGKTGSHIAFEDNPPPGDSYYLGVSLYKSNTYRIGINGAQMAYSEPFSIKASRKPKPSEESISNSLDPVLHGVMLFTSLISMYFYIY